MFSFGSKKPPFDLQSCFRAEGGSTSERTARREESSTVKGQREKLQKESSISRVQKALEEKKKIRPLCREYRTWLICIWKMFIKAVRAEMPWRLVGRGGLALVQ